MQRYRAAQFVAMLALMALAVIGAVAVANGKQEPTGEGSARVCFSAEAWDADDAERPCLTARIAEDGSARIVQWAGGARVVCTLPNPAEGDPGRYRVTACAKKGER